MFQLRPGPGIALHHRLVACREQDFKVVQAGCHEGAEVGGRKVGKEHEKRRIDAGLRRLRMRSFTAFRMTRGRRGTICFYSRQQLQKRCAGKGVELGQAEVHRFAVNGKLDVFDDVTHNNAFRCFYNAIHDIIQKTGRVE